MYTKGKLTSLDVMKDKHYSFIEAEAYIQGIKDSGASDLYEALKRLTREIRHQAYRGMLDEADKALAKVDSLPGETDADEH